MVDQGDVRALRQARTELSKRGIDLQKADIRAMHGVLYIRGTISKLAGVNIPNLKQEMEHIGRVLRQKPDIRDVVVDCNCVG